MNGLTSGQHLDKLVDAPGARFGLLGVPDPVEDRVPIGTRECSKHQLCSRIGTQGNGEILRHLDAGLSGVGGLPSTILSRVTHLVSAPLMHSAGGDQPFCDGNVSLRPRASGFSRRKTSSECGAVAAAYLTINPSEADRLVQRLVVRDGCRFARSLFGKYQPHTLRIGVMVA